MSARGRNITLAVAALLLIAAVVLSSDIARNDPLADLADEINRFDYALTAEDFYVLGGAEDTSIAQVLGEEGADLAPAAAASGQAGFPADTQSVGDVTALLAKTDRGVITVYLLDGNIQLCFLQTEDGEIEPIQ